MSESSGFSRRWKLFLIVGVVSLVADQITKIWARSALPTFTLPDGRSFGRAVEVIPNYWDWRLSYNPGAAFGMFNSTEGGRIFLSIIGLIAVGVIIWMVKKARDDQAWLASALGLIVGGAIGNLIDRIYSGVVTDFIVWKYYDKEWPTFNIADVTLVVGVIMLFIDMTREARREAAAQAAEAAEDEQPAGAGKARSRAARSGRKKKAAT